jgi:hypothetical protein
MSTSRIGLILHGLVFQTLRKIYHGCIPPEQMPAPVIGKKHQREVSEDDVEEEERIQNGRNVRVRLVPANSEVCATSVSHFEKQ